MGSEQELKKDLASPFYTTDAFGVIQRLERTQEKRRTLSSCGYASRLYEDRHKTGYPVETDHQL